MNFFFEKRLLWPIMGLAGIFVIVSFVNNTLYPFPLPLANVLYMAQTPALIASALVTGMSHSIKWVVFYVFTFCTYIIIFSILIFIYQVVFTKAPRSRRR